MVRLALVRAEAVACRASSVGTSATTKGRDGRAALPAEGGQRRDDTPLPRSSRSAPLVLADVRNADVPYGGTRRRLRRRRRRRRRGRRGGEGSLSRLVPLELPREGLVQVHRHVGGKARLCCCDLRISGDPLLDAFRNGAARSNDRRETLNVRAIDWYRLLLFAVTTGLSRKMCFAGFDSSTHAASLPNLGWDNVRHRPALSGA